MAEGERCRRCVRSRGTCPKLSQAAQTSDVHVEYKVVFVANGLREGEEHVIPIGGHCESKGHVS